LQSAWLQVAADGDEAASRGAFAVFPVVAKNYEVIRDDFVITVVRRQPGLGYANYVGL